MDIKTKSFIYGIFVIIIILLLNLIILAVLGFPEMSLEIIKGYLILIILLVGGFSLQVGLFTYFHYVNALTCSTTVASGKAATVSMTLCCSHYLLNIIPFLGALISLSVSITLSRYTLHFLSIGIFSNVLGIGIVFYQHKKMRKKNGGSKQVDIY